VPVTIVIVVVAMVLGAGIGYVLHNPSTSTGNSARAGAILPGAGSGTRSGTRPFGRTAPTPFTSRTGTTRFGSSRTGGSTSAASGSPSTLTAIAAKVDPGLVDINTTLGYDNEQAAGTGMVLTATGEVLTNNHVIDGATKISVTDIGNGRTYPAKVVGYDRTDDVAVIQLNGATGLKTVTVGNSSRVAVGEGVIGIGNAGGAGGSPSVAGGSVTALDQSITASDSGSGTTEQLTGLIETNAGIEPGDSGGPLVNSKGQVVGMDTAASQGFSFRAPGGQAYSIPINEAVTLARRIVSGQASSTVHIGETAFLGVEVRSTSAGGSTSGSARGPGGQFGTRSTSSTSSTTSTTSRGTSPSSTSGAVVAGVLPGTPASGAGLAAGDVITALGGQPVTSPDSLSQLMGTHRPGDKVAVTWIDSSGQSHSATVTLVSGPPQ
jgi:S1-C subfamily serine protease